jgi:CheY-like chemotaxis protein
MVRSPIRVLILDDIELRHDAFRTILPDVDRTHVYTASQAITALLEYPPFDLICLDHDLDQSPDRIVNPGNGTQVARFIARDLPRSHYPKNALIHSANPAGADRMAALIREVGIPVTLKPFRI